MAISAFLLISHILACEPVLHVDTHQAPDEVLRLLGDVVPVGGVKLELACKIYSTLIFDVQFSASMRTI